MVMFNPPKSDPDMPDHELYAQEGHRKFYRPKVNALHKTHESAEMLGRGKPYGHKGD